MSFLFGADDVRSSEIFVHFVCWVHVFGKGFHKRYGLKTVHRTVFFTPFRFPFRFDKKIKAPLLGALIFLERMMGIEPTRSAWKAEVLPLNYIRLSATVIIISLFRCIVKC